MAGNPFQYLRPVSPDAFIGRWGLVDEIAADLLNERAESHAIIAGRRCGKSSTLIALAHQIRELPANDTTDRLALPLMLDFKSGEFDSAGSIFAHILHEVHRRVDATARRRPQDAWPNPVMLEADWFHTLSASPSLSLSDFQDALGYILDQLGTPLQPVRLVLLLDEMDETVERPWTAALYNQLRALVYSGDLRDQVRLVLTGSRRFLDAMNDRGSPLWNILEFHYFQSFNQSETDKMISQAEGLSQEGGPSGMATEWRPSLFNPVLTILVSRMFL